MNFKTEEYEYALTNLDGASRAELFSCIKAFIESVQQVIPITEIAVSAAAAAYSSEEIDQCTEEILASPKNTLSREKLAQRYKGFQVFDVYQELFGADFLPVHYNLVSRSEDRARLFKRMVKKSFPEWEVIDEVSGGNFYLKQRVSEDRKHSESDS